MTQKHKAKHPAPKPYAGLKTLNKLVGTWKVFGPGIKGKVRFEWMTGGFFLMQHVDLIHGGQKIKGVELIGYERPFGQTKPSKDIHSRWFGNTGDTFEYVYEVNAKTLTIWGGEKGSPAYYKGKWSADDNTNTGGWVYPDGGGYQSSMTRMK
jgi:hypothetical protein